MEILHIEKRGQLRNTLERFHLYDLSIQKLQMNDPYTATHNPIFDIIIRYTHYNNTYPKDSPLTITHQTHPLALYNHHPPGISHDIKH
jgi:hypothetical protein